MFYICHLCALHRQAPVLLHDLPQRPDGQRLQSRRVPRRENRCVSHSRKFDRSCLSRDSDLLTRQFPQGKTMLCLPQAFELFLKNLVGGLHTVYTKCKRYFGSAPSLWGSILGFAFFVTFHWSTFFWPCILRAASAKGQCLGAGGERLTGGWDWEGVMRG